MTGFTLTVKDEGVRTALNALAARVNNMPAVLDTIGVGIIERTQRRFETSTGPDGIAWKANSATTLAMLSASIGASKSNRKKDGSLNAKGSRMLANKKPLINTGDLMRQFQKDVINHTLIVSNTMLYAAIHQFGGKAGRGLKVTIPARPYLPIRSDGTLYPDDQVEILKAINQYLASGR
jgi:phage virion morphogenesis protein